MIESIILLGLLASSIVTNVLIFRGRQPTATSPEILTEVTLNSDTKGLA